MSKWISVKDRLPPEKIFCSIYIATIFSNLKFKSFVEPLHYIDGEWFTMSNEGCLDPEYEVTHWIPLPEAPCE